MNNLAQRLLIEFLQIFIIIALVLWVYSKSNLYINNKKEINNIELKRKNIEVKVAILFIFIFLITFVFINFDTKLAKNKLNSILMEEIYSLDINGNNLNSKNSLLVAIKDMCNRPPHHSHTIKKLTLTIKTSTESFDLELLRDSQDPNEYWVYFPKYSRSAIGRICTNELTVF